MKYIEPEMEIEELDEDDVIVTSLAPENDTEKGDVTINGGGNTAW